MTIRPVPETMYVDDCLVDSMIYNIHMHLMGKYNQKVADEDIEPLFWYFRTRKPTGYFTWLLVSKKPYMIARKLHEARGLDPYHVMQSILDFIGYKEDPRN